MEKEKKIVILIYSVGIILYGILLYYLILRKYISFPIFIIALGTILVLILNMVFSSSNTNQTYDTELSIYEYVEKNASTIAIVAIAIVLLITLYDKEERDNFKVELFTKIIIVSFIFAVSILIIVWVPFGNGNYLRYLRDVKTCLLTFSLSFLIIGMIFFIQNGFKK